MPRVYFATNRAPDPAQPGGYGSAIVDPSKIVYAATDVSGIDLTDEDSGSFDTLLLPQIGDFAGTLQDEILSAPGNVLVFIHGFDNSFADAIKRAAFNHDWFADSGQPGSNATILAFTWPSLGELIENPGNLTEGYQTDQAMAGASGPHIADFLSVVSALRTKLAPGRRVILLAHSMGNFALGAAVTAWFGAGNEGAVLFDEVILAAADEAADTFIQPDSRRLTRLPELAGRISIYTSRRDIAMSLSQGVNNDIRVGFDGPAQKGDPTVYPPARFLPTNFRSIDCTEVYDYSAIFPIDATHQYYRRSKTVRVDIVAVMAGLPMPPGQSALSTGPLG